MGSLRTGKEGKGMGGNKGSAIIDITQEIFTCSVFPGDPAPERRRLMRLGDGDVCNLTAFSMCAHNGTHMDAPYHFLADGKKIHEIALETFVGPARVVEHQGRIEEADAERILSEGWEASADWACVKGRKRILIKGDAVLTIEAARVFVKAGILLYGNESQTVGEPGEPESQEIHRVMLQGGIPLLEGVCLEGVEPGMYILHAVPIKLGGSDGAPCRAFLYRKAPWEE